MKPPQVVGIKFVHLTKMATNSYNFVLAKMSSSLEAVM